MRHLLGLSMVMLLAGAGCGNGLKQRVDDAVLTDVPMNQRQGPLQARNEMNRADEERIQAQLQVERSDNDLVQATDGVRQAKLEVDRAEQERAQQQWQSNSVALQRASERLRLAELAESAEEMLQMRLRRLRDAGRRAVDAADAHRQAAAARYELEKARLAQAHGKYQRRGLNIAAFEAQATELERRYDVARAEATRLHNLVLEADRVYNRRIAEYAQLRGQFPDITPAYAPAGYVPSVYPVQQSSAPLPPPM
jgi:chromosome segregation ATPase